MTKVRSPHFHPTDSFPRFQFSRRNFLQSAVALFGSQVAGPFDLLHSPRAGPGRDSHLPGCMSPLRTPYPPQLQGIIAKLEPSADNFPSEQYVEELERVLQAWSLALCQPNVDLSALLGDLTDPFEVSPLQPSEVRSLRAGPSLSVERRSFHAPLGTSLKKFLADFSKYLVTFARIETAELEIFDLRIAADAPLRVDTEIRCDLVGTGKDGTREQRVGSWSVSWVRDAQQPWRAQRLVVHPEKRSLLTGPGFVDITADCIDTQGEGMQQLLAGIDEWRTVLDGACGIDVYGNHGIAVGDIDGCGFDSFYVCQPSGLPNRLYKNRGDGTFEDITQLAGVGILDGTASALFADFLNRGKQDLLVVRTSGPLLFMNEGGGRFQANPGAFKFSHPPQGTFTSAAIADYDRDGLLDVYFCVYSYYQGLNQYQFPTPYYDAQNGPPNFLFRNRGDGTFEDETSAAGLDENNNRFSFAAAWCDYDNSGWPSIYVANDFGRKNLYRNNGDGTFRDIAHSAGVEDYGPGMSACWMDADNDGLQDIYVANMWLKEGKRITANPQFLPDAPPGVRALYQKHNAGNSMYRNAGKGSFENESVRSGCEMGRWSWSCASWDFDHDGFADLYVANGFVSGCNPYDLQSFFWRQVARHSLEPAGTSPEYEMGWNAVNELVRSDYSWSGNQRNVFFVNNRDGTFSDVSGILGLDLRDDCRAYALSDFDHDGRLEFALKNRTGSQLKIFRNDMQHLGPAIAVRLVGQTSNRDAIGATATVHSAGHRQTKFVSAGSGFASQHSKELFFGLGDSAQEFSISVRWPTGVVETFEKMPINCRLEITEGSKQIRKTFFRPRVQGRPAPQLTPYPKLPLRNVRTRLIAPLFAPDIHLPDINGATHQLSAMKGQPLLACFFRIACGESRNQLEELQRAVADLGAAGIATYTIAAEPSTGLAAVSEWVRSLKMTFPALLADERTLGAWNIQFRYLFDRRRDMTFPISFLFDQSGALTTIYQGVTAPSQIISDWNSDRSFLSTNPSPADRLARAVPFPGPYYGNPISQNDFTFAIAFVEYGYLEEAQAALQRVVQSNPAYAAAWFNLGTIFLNKKQYPDARRCLMEAVRLDPQDADAWNNLGLISGDEQKYEEALREFQTSARANPNYLVPVENMLGIYRYQARAADAQKALEELIVLAPENAGLHLALGMALAGQNEFLAAQRELETAVRLRPGNTDALNNLGVIRLRLGNRQQALSDFEECQRRAPDFDRPFINAALIYGTEGLAEKARKILQGFLSRHPDNVDVEGALQRLGSK